MQLLSLLKSPMVYFYLAIVKGHSKSTSITRYGAPYKRWGGKKRNLFGFICSGICLGFVFIMYKATFLILWYSLCGLMRLKASMKHCFDFSDLEWPSKDV